MFNYNVMLARKVLHKKHSGLANCWAKPLILGSTKETWNVVQHLWLTGRECGAYGRSAGVQWFNSPPENWSGVQQKLQDHDSMEKSSWNLKHCHVIEDETAVKWLYCRWPPKLFQCMLHRGQRLYKIVGGSAGVHSCPAGVWWLVGSSTGPWYLGD